MSSAWRHSLGHLLVEPVKLVEVDAVELQPAQASDERIVQMLGRGVVIDVPWISGPMMRIAPNPTRFTVRSPPMVKVRAGVIPPVYTSGTITVLSPGTSERSQACSTSCNATGRGMSRSRPALISAISDGSSAR